MKRRRLIAVVLVVCLAVGAAGFLVYRAWQGSAIYYFTVTEIKAQGSSLYGKTVRVNGVVVPGSIVREEGSFLVTFTIAEGGETLSVTYNGVAPDTFKDDAEVVVEGRLSDSGVFQADTLLAKCPSKYEPQTGE